MLKNIKEDIETKEELNQILREEPKTRDHRIKGFENKIHNLWREPIVKKSNAN